MLLLATVCWGMGFSWAKNVGDAVNGAAGRPTTAALGPMTGLALRFGLATLAWAVCVPEARRDWSWQTFRRGVAIGGMLSIGLILQHLGLGLTDEPTTAFLTNLTVVFVPAWQWSVTRQTPRRPLLAAVPIALLGMVLLSGIGRPGPLSGPLFGIACAVAFAAEILLLDRLGRGESAARITLVLLGTAAVCSATVAVSVGGVSDIHWRTLGTVRLLADLLPAVGLTTVLAFALMTKYQPKVDPTRAAVIYLGEPLFATAYAWLYNGRSLTAATVVGAALILLANAVAEWKPRRV